MKIGLFYDANIPFDGIRPGSAELQAISRFADIISLENYERQLAAGYDCLVNLHGSRFIKQAWPYIISHLSSGKGLVNIGSGVPFSVPVRDTDNGAQVEYCQTAYHNELYIVHGMPIPSCRCLAPAINDEIPLLKGFEGCFDEQETVSLMVKYSQKHDDPDPSRIGSAGPVDAVMRALLYAHDKTGLRTAAPVVLVENFKDKFTGGRWIFVNQAPGQRFWGSGGPELINKLAVYAAGGAYDFLVRPNYTAYYTGERLVLLLQGQSFNTVRGAAVTLSVTKDENEVYRSAIPFRLARQMDYVSIPTELNVEPGYYTITAEVSVDGECARYYRSGFWGYDEALLQSGSEITCGRDYFLAGGKPYPVVGMTYMDPDSHRQFLTKPNVYYWNRDIALMKSQGVNMIRTGNWGYYRRIMQIDGLPSEESMRAVDAFILSAKKYGIPVIFTFFAFTPMLWEGINPYLDPRAVEAQKRFIRAVVCRHKLTRGN